MCLVGAAGFRNGSEGSRATLFTGSSASPGAGLEEKLLKAGGAVSPVGPLGSALGSGLCFATLQLPCNCGKTLELSGSVFFSVGGI